MASCSPHLMQTGLYALAEHEDAPEFEPAEGTRLPHFSFVLTLSWFFLPCQVYMVNIECDSYSEILLIF